MTVVLKTTAALLEPRGPLIDAIDKGALSGASALDGGENGLSGHTTLAHAHKRHRQLHGVVILQAGGEY